MADAHVSHRDRDALAPAGLTGLVGYLLRRAQLRIPAELVAGQFAQLPHPSGRITRAIGLTVRRNWVPTEAQRELIDALRDQVHELGLNQDPHPIVPPRRAPGRPATRGTSPGCRSG